MSTQCYFEGDFWNCLATANAGESPSASPSKWQKVALLSKWRWVLAQLTFAYLLESDGQMDKAGAARNLAYGRENMGLEDLARQEEAEESNRRCRRGRPARVNTGRTRPIRASVVLEDAYRLMNWDTAQLDTREEQDARAAFSRALQEVWEKWWWQEKMSCEPLTFAPTAQRGVEVGAFAENQNIYYWPLTDTYFVLYGDVAQDPTDDTGAITQPFAWAKLDFTRSYPKWTPDTTYVRGDDAARVSWNGVNYVLMGNPTALNVEPQPDGSTEWYVLPENFPQFPYTDNTYTDPVSGATVGELGPLGPIRSVSKYDPRSAPNPGFFEVEVNGEATRVVNLTVGRPWVWHRAVTPVITGDAWDAETSYAPDADAVVVPPVEENQEVFYLAAGQNPNNTQVALRPAIAYGANGEVWLKTNDTEDDQGWEQRL